MVTDIDKVINFSPQVDTIYEKFKELPKDIQIIVAEKLTRFATNQVTYILIKDEVVVQECQTVRDILLYFKALGIPKPSRSNIYKWINKDRLLMYGHTIEIIKEII